MPRGRKSAGPAAVIPENNPKPIKSTTTKLKRSQTVKGPSSKKAKLISIKTNPKHDRGTGKLYTFGIASCHQLGINARSLQRKFPAIVEVLEKQEILDVAAGGMHTLVLTKAGEVYSFGCNDDFALGRNTMLQAQLNNDDNNGSDEDTPEDKRERKPTKVDFDFKQKVTQISCGDSHSAALTENGDVYIWGTFKNQSGKIGLIPKSVGDCHMTPQKVEFPEDPFNKITRIASGENHLIMLSDSGKIYSIGNSEVIGRFFRGTRSKNLKPLKDFWLSALEVRCERTRTRFKNIWTGLNGTYCESLKNEIWSFGHNGCGQLGTNSDNIVDTLTKPSEGFLGKKWLEISGGGQHTVALDEDGKVYTLGRGDDGRLGLGDEDINSRSKPTLVPALSKIKCVSVAAGLSVSYAISESGDLYSWGFGENWQLASGPENDDSYLPQKCVKNIKKEPIEGKVIVVSGGGQHSALILKVN